METSAVVIEDGPLPDAQLALENQRIHEVSVTDTWARPDQGASSTAPSPKDAVRFYLMQPMISFIRDSKIYPDPKVFMHMSVTVEERKMPYGEFLSLFFLKVRKGGQSVYVFQPDGPLRRAKPLLLREKDAEDMLGGRRAKFDIATPTKLGFVKKRFVTTVVDDSSGGLPENASLLPSQTVETHSQMPNGVSSILARSREEEYARIQQDWYEFLTAMDAAVNDPKSRDSFVAAYVNIARVSLADLFFDSPLWVNTVDDWAPFQVGIPLHLSAPKTDSWNVQLLDGLTTVILGTGFSEPFEPEKLRAYFADKELRGLVIRVFNTAYHGACRGDPARYQWFMANISAQITHPWLKTGKFQVLVGSQGCGKTTLLNLLVILMLGHKYARSASNFDRAGFGRFDDPSNSATMKATSIEELRFTAYGQPVDREAIKDRVTNEVRQYEIKCGPVITARTAENYFSASNHLFPITADERRFVVFGCVRYSDWNTVEMLKALRDPRVCLMLRAIFSCDISLWRSIGLPDGPLEVFAVEKVPELSFWMPTVSLYRIVGRSQQWSRPKMEAFSRSNYTWMWTQLVHETLPQNEALRNKALDSTGKYIDNFTALSVHPFTETTLSCIALQYSATLPAWSALVKIASRICAFSTVEETVVIPASSRANRASRFFSAAPGAKLSSGRSWEELSSRPGIHLFRQRTYFDSAELLLAFPWPATDAHWEERVPATSRFGRFNAGTEEEPSYLYPVSLACLSDLMHSFVSEREIQQPNKRSRTSSETVFSDTNAKIMSQINHYLPEDGRLCMVRDFAAHTSVRSGVGVTTRGFSNLDPEQYNLVIPPADGTKIVSVPVVYLPAANDLCVAYAETIAARHCDASMVCWLPKISN